MHEDTALMPAFAKDGEAETIPASIIGHDADFHPLGDRLAPHIRGPDGLELTTIVSGMGGIHLRICL
jgi:hypothetical protein